MVMIVVVIVVMVVVVVVVVLMTGVPLAIVAAQEAFQEGIRKLHGMFTKKSLHHAITE